MGKDGKQYVSIYAAGGANKKKLVPGTVFVYSLP
jgi:hypothetical protein